MAKKKISEFANKATPDSGDLFLIEQSDGTYKNVLKSDIAGTTSGTNTGDETAARIATINHGTSAKTTLVDADELTGQDSANSFSLIRVTCLNVYNYLKTKFDTVYSALASPTFTGTVKTPAIIVSSETASRVAIIDASKNVKSADTTTYPSLTELSYVKGASSNLQNQITGLYNIYAVNVGSLGATAPADSTTYYAGTMAATGLPTATNVQRRFVAPITGTAFASNWLFTQAAASGESVTVVIANVTQGTTYTLTSALVLNATATNVNYDVNLAVTKGDSLEMRFTTPAWATNPTGWIINGMIYFK